MAVLSQCFSYYCCMESLGKLPPTLRAPHGRRKRHSPNFLRGWTAANTGSSSNTNTRRAGRPRDRQRGQRLQRLFQCFSSFGRGAETRYSCCRGVPSVLFLCASEVVGAGGTGQRERAAAGEASPQWEAGDGGQQTARQAHRRKEHRKRVAERRCARWGDRWSRPRHCHRRTGSRDPSKGIRKETKRVSYATTVQPAPGQTQRREPGQQQYPPRSYHPPPTALQPVVESDALRGQASGPKRN